MIRHPRPFFKQNIFVGFNKPIEKFERRKKKGIPPLFLFRLYLDSFLCSTRQSIAQQTVRSESMKRRIWADAVYS